VEGNKPTIRSKNLMRNLAGGTTFLGATALLAGFLFYFQPTVEAVNLASESPQNQQTTSQSDNSTNNQQNQLEATQVSNPADNSKSNNKQSVESNAFRATAYCLKGRTAMGSGVRRGIVAADPRVLPLGSQIQLNAGSYSGTYTVADTGGAVKGRKLDIWVPSCSEAIRFGRKTVMVSRIGKNNKKA
jgi:3D (Asp-Asp-Asp) domain-containing protein